MSHSVVNSELEAAKANQLAGRPLTPGEEVLIAVDESNRAAIEAVDRGLAQSNRVTDMQRVKTFMGKHL